VFFVASFVTSFAHIVIGNFCASMKDALRHTIVDNGGVEFKEGGGITMLR
jgi:hypothetical protein